MLALTALVAACATSAPGTADSQFASLDSSPTFYADVIPILQENCQVCHMENGQNLGGMVAPVAFTSYETTKEWAPRIARAVRTRQMPPWDAALAHKGDFSNERVLEDSEIATLLAWAQSGTLAGDPADAPRPREFNTATSGWSIGEPDLIVQLNEPYLVADDVEDLYINFDVEITAEQLPEDRWIKAVEFRAGSSAVHHVIANPIGGIAPGVEARVFPDGYGTVLRKGTKVSFNMHYHKEPGAGTAVWDQTSVAIVFYEPGEIIEHVVEGNDLGMFRFEIPANDPNYSFHSEFTFEQDANILWMLPHMHLRGKAALYEITLPGGEKETLLDVPTYDFNWQHTYALAEPVFAPAGTKIDLTLWWDNSAANPNNPNPNRAVRFGRPTTDEMGFGFLSYTQVEPRRFVAGEPIPEDLAERKVVGGGN
jgi:hypothetical protein